MNRRKFLVGFGGACVGGGTLVGSDAFSATTAKRNVTVAVEDDSKAYLKLTLNDRDFASKNGKGLIQFEFDDEFEATPGEYGDGVGTDSVYEFHHVFTAENQGTSTIHLFGEYNDDEVADIKLMQSTDVNKQEGGKPNPLTDSNRSDGLTPGDQVGLGFLVDSTGVDLGTKNTDISIIAASDDSDVYE
jgi:hypothetical protein